MFTRRPKNIISLLSAKKGTLARIVKATDNHSIILQRVRELLPASLAAECYSISLTDHRLIIYTTSPAWSNKLRFLLPQLRQALYKKFELIFTDVQARAIPEKHKWEGSKKPARRCHLSSESAESIKAVAASIDDTELRNALERLATHTPLPGSD